MNDNREFKLALANAIVYQLWVKNLISDAEKERIMQKNKASFIS